MNKRFVCQHCACTYPDFDVAHVCSRGPYAPKLKLKKNDRIKELAEEAERYADDNFKGEHFWTEAYESKFAELIVRECIAKAEEESERYLTWNTEDCNRFSKVMQNYKELLKEHFGVEI